MRFGARSSAVPPAACTVFPSGTRRTRIRNLSRGKRLFSGMRKGLTGGNYLPPRASRDYEFLLLLRDGRRDPAALLSPRHIVRTAFDTLGKLLVSAIRQLASLISVRRA